MVRKRGRPPKDEAELIWEIAQAHRRAPLEPITVTIRSLLQKKGWAVPKPDKAVERLYRRYLRESRAGAIPEQRPMSDSYREHLRSLLEDAETLPGRVRGAWRDACEKVRALGIDPGLPTDHLQNLNSEFVDRAQKAARIASADPLDLIQARDPASLEEAEAAWNEANRERDHCEERATAIQKLLKIQWEASRLRVSLQPEESEE